MIHRWLSNALCKISRSAKLRAAPKGKLWGNNSFWQQLCPSILLPTHNNMEVTRADFEKNDSQLLKDIIQAIKEAQFVAIDLEFSGVPRRANDSASGKPTVADRYRLLKDGAERYQVLQLGICVVHYDEPTRSYVCRPYSLPVCPVTDSRWNMEREYTYQSSAIKFLSDNKFDFNLLFGHGIPYLNHDEEKAVRAREREAIEGVMEDIHVEDGQKEFLKEVVDELQAWVNDPKPEYDFVNITGPGNEINGYQKRLVHQVVRAQFPGLVTLSRNKFIQVIKKDEEQEKRLLKEKKERSDEKIKRGIGLRYIIDAMRESKVPVVGHNLFGDLVHLYRTFVGKLPGSVEEFAAAVHNDFPVVCDTKYLATCEGTITGVASNLQTLNETLSALTYPSISLHMEHQMGSTVHHNAGYDSYNTAKVFLRIMTVYQCHLKQVGSGAIAEQVARASMVEFLNRMGRINPEQFLHQDLLLPPFSSPIWNGLKNCLRVNGTMENVVLLEEEGGVKLGSLP